MNALLSIAAACEALTGLGLVVDPALVVRLLLGAEPSGSGLPMGRVAGIALLALGLACWPDRDAPAGRAPVRAMLLYNVLATIYLLGLGVQGEWIGRLLWAAVAAHATLGLLLAGAGMRAQAPKGART